MKHKSEKGGMRSAKMPGDHWEKGQGELAKECQLKYATEFGNPQSLDKMTSGLSSYVKKRHMKYE